MRRPPRTPAVSSSTVLVVGAVAVLVLLVWIGGTAPSSRAGGRRSPVTMAAYSTIAVGDSYENVVARLGPGIEDSSDEILGHPRRMMSWLDGRGGGMVLLFVDGRVTSKSQHDLR